MFIGELRWNLPLYSTRPIPVASRPMSREETLLRVRAVIVAGYSSDELFQEETGYPIHDLPPVVPDIVDRWIRARWAPPGRRPALLEAIRSL